ncbi:unnamed protein product [Rotaria magnacalcarata]|uniref:Uncharacterized protein n=1 Tax=Rotaria magnacalcarata TaxID=392030 RepID=A0A8S2KPD5_9BILA|nr:unnamed protein product [Rotaria magnacalcarata]
MPRILNTAIGCVAVRGQNTIISTASSCECRPSQQCRANPVPCSVNVDCECLLMTMTVGGMCAQYCMCQ